MKKTILAAGVLVLLAACGSVPDEESYLNDTADLGLNEADALDAGYLACRMVRDGQMSATLLMISDYIEFENALIVNVAAVTHLCPEWDQELREQLEVVQLGLETKA